MNPLISFLGLTALPSLGIALYLNHRLQKRAPGALPYTWGYYLGLQQGLLYLLLGCSVLLDLSERGVSVEALALLAFLVLGAYASVAGIQRYRHGFTMMSIASLNPIVWIINYVYGSKRWHELRPSANSLAPSLAATALAPPLPPPSKPPLEMAAPHGITNSEEHPPTVFSSSELLSAYELFKAEHPGIDSDLLRILSRPEARKPTTAPRRIESDPQPGRLTNILMIWGHHPYRDYVISLARHTDPNALHSGVNELIQSLPPNLSPNVRHYLSALDGSFGEHQAFWANASTRSAMTSFLATAARVWSTETTDEVAAFPTSAFNQPLAEALFLLATRAYAYAYLTSGNQQALIARSSPQEAVWPSRAL